MELNVKGEPIFDLLGLTTVEMAHIYRVLNDASGSMTIGGVDNFSVWDKLDNLLNESLEGKRVKELSRESVDESDE